MHRAIRTVMASRIVRRNLSEFAYTVCSGMKHQGSFRNRLMDMQVPVDNTEKEGRRGMGGEICLVVDRATKLKKRLIKRLTARK